MTARSPEPSQPSAWRRDHQGPGDPRAAAGTAAPGSQALLHPECSSFAPFGDKVRCPPPSLSGYIAEPWLLRNFKGIWGQPCSHSGDQGRSERVRDRGGCERAHTDRNAPRHRHSGWWAKEAPPGEPRPSGSSASAARPALPPEGLHCACRLGKGPEKSCREHTWLPPPNMFEQTLF